MVSERKLYIKYRFVKIPSVAMTGKAGALYGRSIFGSRTRNNQTAPQIIANAKRVPELVNSDTLSMGVNAATQETTNPTKIVLFQGVLKVGCIAAKKLSVINRL